MKKQNIWSMDFRSYQIMIVERWKARRFFWNKGHLNFLRFSYLTSIFWRVRKTKRIKKEVRSFYQNHFFPQMRLNIFDKPKTIQKVMF